LNNFTYGVLIPNWNGEAYIERALGSVLAAARRTGRVMEVVVVDDASTDRSPELIEKSFPGVRLIRLAQNVGFGRAVGIGMAALAAEWVFLLNNDLALQSDFCERLIATLGQHDPEGLFAIGAQTRDWASQAPNHSGQRAAWREGLIVQEPFDSPETRPTDFFQAGACLVNRARFLKLGGFASIYHPGYWEDYDLAWQARRRGWVNLYEPLAVAYHWGQGSMRRRYGEWGVSLLVRRNHLLFVWANLSDPWLLARHFLALPGQVLRQTTREGEAGWGRALLAALGRLPAALRLRRKRLAERDGLPAAELLHLK